MRNVLIVYLCVVKILAITIATIIVVVVCNRWIMEFLDITITARSSATGRSWMVMRKALWRRTSLKSVSSSTTYPQFTNHCTFLNMNHILFYPNFSMFLCLCVVPQSSQSFLTTRRRTRTPSRTRTAMSVSLCF